MRESGSALTSLGPCRRCDGAAPIVAGFAQERPTRSRTKGSMILSDAWTPSASPFSNSFSEEAAGARGGGGRVHRLGIARPAGSRAMELPTRFVSAGVLERIIHFTTLRPKGLCPWRRQGRCPSGFGSPASGPPQIVASNFTSPCPCLPRSPADVQVRSSSCRRQATTDGDLHGRDTTTALTWPGTAMGIACRLVQTQVTEQLVRTCPRPEFIEVRVALPSRRHLAVRR